uniref:TLC domain-containing protein n=1 Tax=Leptobrachium leishanense TaxID=445787 RepID=A0A8C5N215_9ANUR
MSSLLDALIGLDYDDLDYSSWSTCLVIMALGFLGYLGIFVLCHFLSHGLCSTYSSLSAKEKVFWDLTATRAVFGVQSTHVGLTTLLFEPVLASDKVSAQQNWSWCTILIVSGFFFFENVALHVFNIAFWTCDIFLVVHHLFAFLGVFGVVVYGTPGHYLPLAVLFLEMSTPFTCISWSMLKAGLSDTLFWKANQWVVIHMLHCRIVLTYHIWWVCYCNWDKLLNSTPSSYLALFFTGLALVTFVMNPYWTHKKTQQLLSPVEENFEMSSTKSSSSSKGNSGLKKTK